ncbi:hypothetical protein EDD22DRAFT_952271 [Suillus occidentalis]|nr:hypothetical protein EDD22DRAFT_952271 [Suillus occidentalis]
MPFITIPASKKHKSLLEYDSGLDSNGSDEDDIRIKELSEEEKPDDDNDNGEDNEPEPAKILTPPLTTSKKRKHGKIPPSDPPASIKEVTFITSITSAAEMKRPASKRTSRNQTFTLNLDKPWDTMKAQMLVKISDALNPGLLSYEDYEISWFIPCVLPKPGCFCGCPSSTHKHLLFLCTSACP